MSGIDTYHGAKQTIRIHILPTEPMSFEIPIEETVLSAEIHPERVYQYTDYVVPERLVLITTNKV